jgi:hypothetical protein
MKKYMKNGFGLRLPKDLCVVSDIPHFFAESDDSTVTLAIQRVPISIAEKSWTASKRELKSKVIPCLEIIRENEIDAPFVGFERVQQYRDPDYLHFDWFVFYTLNNEGIIVAIGAYGEFEHEESKWKEVLDSIVIT